MTTLEAQHEVITNLILENQKLKQERDEALSDLLNWKYNLAMEGGREMSASNHNDGGNAFPQVNYVKPADGYGVSIMEIRGGMPLRDWFAGQALAGILAGGFASTIPHDDVSAGSDAAFFAYIYAEAMLAEREGKEGAK